MNRYVLANKLSAYRFPFHFGILLLFLFSLRQMQYYGECGVLITVCLPTKHCHSLPREG